MSVKWFLFSPELVKGNGKSNSEIQRLLDQTEIINQLLERMEESPYSTQLSDRSPAHTIMRSLGTIIWD